MGVSPECVGAVVAASGNRMTDAEAAELIRYTETLRRGEEAAGNLDGLDARVRQRAAEQAERAQIAAAVARKHAALSAIAYSRGLADLNRLVAAGLDRRKALLAFLEGSSRNVEGARASVAATALAYRTRFMRRIHDAITRDPELRDLVERGDPASADAVLREMRELRESGKPGSTGHTKAAELARIYAQAAEESRLDLNRLGATIGKLDGWTPQSHASDRVVKVDRDEWVDFILPRLDRERTFPGLGDEMVRITLRDIYDTIITGVDRNGSVAGETGRVGPANLANRLSSSRVLHFTDADAWLQYRERFGNGHIHDAILGHLNAAAKAAAQMDRLGPNPENTLTRLRAELERQAATDERLTPQQRQAQARAVSPTNRGGTVQSAWAEVSGLTATPVAVRAATIGTQVRAWESMAKLGGAVLSAITDLPVRAAALRYQGKSVLAAGAENLAEFFKGRGSTADQRRIAAQIGAGMDGILGHIATRWGAEDMPMGKWHKAQETFFRLSGLTWWTDAMKAGSVRMLSRWMADNAGLTWDGLGARYQATLRQHGISPAEWDAIRATAWQADDGARYITPDRLAQLPRTVLAGLARERLEAMQKGLAAKAAQRAQHTATEAGWVQRRTEKFRESLARSRAAFEKRSAQRAEGADAKVAKARDAIAEVEARLSELAEFHQAMAEGRAWQEAAPEAAPDGSLAARNVNPETGERRRLFQGKAEDWLDTPPEQRTLRAQGEERARLDRLRRAIGNVRRATKGADVRELEAFDAHWIEREAELAEFAHRMDVRAKQRQALNTADTLEWQGRVDQALADTARDLDVKLRRFFADEMGFAVIESDAQARRMTIRGTQGGSITGELTRYLAQFKAFPVAFSNRVLGRAVMGYGPGERMLQGRNAGVLLAGLMVAGYAAITAKDAARGQAPRDPTKPGTWLAVLVQSGGAGIYGDFLFAQASRFGNSALETAAGPVLGAGAGAANLWAKVRSGDAKAGEVLNFALQNTPFLNLWYTRPVLDFLVLNAAREALSPGFLKRQQDARRKDYGQERLYPPTAFAF